MPKRCECGKLHTFQTKDEALSFILSPHGTYLGVVRAYKCDTRDVYHVTRKRGYYSQPNERVQTLEVELHREMTTVKEHVVNYIKDKYRLSGGKEYKCTSSEIRKALEKKQNFTAQASSVSLAIGKLKSEGIITQLDEKDPDRKGPASYYFTLTSILDEITNPDSANEEEEKNVANDKVPAQPTKTPLTVAANPFDKVNERLNLIFTQLSGLATGYSQIVEHQQAMRNALTQEESHTLNAVTDARTQIMDLLRVIVDEGRTVSTPTGAEIAEAVNIRLQDLRTDNSFIHAVRRELDDRIYKSEEKNTQEISRIVHFLNNLPIPSSVANANDYREGIKEGIRIGAELGLSIKSE